MSQEEFEILTRDKIRNLIEAHKEADPIQFALTHSNNDFPTALVSSQLKSLQKARKKLPQWYAATAILPERAVEQASSEQTARLKQFQGQRLLDLSGGLGVDSFYLSQGFAQTLMLEPNPVLAQVACYNFELLGNHSIEVKTATASEFLSQYTGPPFDLIYVDPDRRDLDGNRLNDLTAGSPDILSLLPHLRPLGKTLLIKASPLFDLHEAYRLFPTTKELSVVSIDNECKELLLQVDLLSAERQSPAMLTLQWKRGKNVGAFQTTYPFHNPSVSVQVEAPVYLCEPDVVFYKAGIVPFYFHTQYASASGGLTHPYGYFFAQERLDNFPGRQFEVLEAMPYKPRALKKWLKQKKISRLNLSKRHFPLPIKTVRQQLGIAEGGDAFLLLTEWNNEKWAFYANRSRLLP